MHEPPRRDGNQGPNDPQNSARLKMAMRARGWRKLVLLTVAANQALTTAFVYVAQQVDPGLTMMDALIFSCVTCGLVSYWLRTDAHRAWCNAVQKGYVGPHHGANDEGVLKIAEKCPRRWLVVLHIELNPELAGTA
ncbi:hypothetical protein AB3X94_16175 [Paraburkholderia sp. BR10923]|uniref:Uncharacterized protein n=1 Tax=Paraburkholderia youngii TaxID=2782701 RepID=A0A7Y6K354_9BURK|nr:hypothetical protein [Paraburkholderia youngii]NUY02724.1 hypothetical protein [Paraburkholderia youngii]